MSDTTTGGGLKTPRESRKVGVLAGLRKALGGTRTPQAPVRDPEGLRELLRADRIQRRMTWPAYAQFLGVKLSTLHKIATGVHLASELTEAAIRDTLDANQ